MGINNFRIFFCAPPRKPTKTLENIDEMPLFIQVQTVFFSLSLHLVCRRRGKKLISRLKAFITQIAYVSTDIKERIDNIETLTMLTKNQLVEQPPSSTAAAKAAQTPAPKPNSILANNAREYGNNNSLTGADNHLKANNTTYKPIKNVKLYDVDVSSTSSITTYFAVIYGNKCEKMKNVENLFGVVGPILIKLESLVLSTSMGKLNNMHLYYDFWKNQLSQLLFR